MKTVTGFLDTCLSERNPYRRVIVAMWVAVGWMWGALMALLWVGPNSCG